MRNKEISIILGILIFIIFTGLLGIGGLFYDNKKLRDEVVVYDKNGTQKSVFASNGVESFLCCSKDNMFALYFIDKKEFRKLPYKYNDNERIIRMAVDDSGNCSLLIYSSEDEIIDNQLLSTITDGMARIDVINSCGKIIKQYNVGGFLSSKNIPNSFLTHDSVVYTMDCDGVATIADVVSNKVDTYDMGGRVTSADVNEGNVVVTYCNNGSSYLKIISIEGEEISTVKLPKSNCKYGICQFRNGNVLIFNKEKGFYEYDPLKKKIFYLNSTVNNLLGVGFGKGIICVLCEEGDEYELHYMIEKESQ